MVGVVADGRYRELQATRLDIYLSHLQADTPLGYLVVRATGEPTALASSIRAIVRSLDDTVAITEIASMDQIVSQALGNPRFAAIVFGMFGLVALALAALGVYGLLAYAVTCRTQEIGVRMALGARVADVLGAVLGSTIRLTLAGIAIGLVSAALAGAARRRTAVWRPAVRPDHVCDGARRARARRARRMPRPGAARGARRSAGGAQVRVNRI